MHLFPKILSMTAVAIAATINTPVPASAASQNCLPLFETKVITLPGAHSTTSKTFVNVPEAVAHLSLGEGSCVVVQFSAQVHAKTPDAVRVKLLFDGEDAGFPATTEFSTSDARIDGRTVNFVLPNVPGGNHALRLQFMSVEGGPVTLSRSLMIIRYLDAF